MKSNERCVVVIGGDNIFHYGIFRLIETECIRKHLSVLYYNDVRQFRLNLASRNYGGFHLAILCLGYYDFFPCWFSTFLTLLRKTEGNVLVFTDNPKLLSKRKKNLLNRVCDMEYVLDISMPVAYISFLLEHYLNRKRALAETCKISMRELAVIDGFLNGVNAECHSSKLGIEIRTLYQHRKNCANKLGVRNLKDLLRL